MPKKLWIKFPTMEAYEEKEERLNAILGESEGNDSVVIYVEATREMKKLPANRNVKADQTLVQILGSAFGEENVKVV